MDEKNDNIQNKVCRYSFVYSDKVVRHIENVKNICFAERFVVSFWYICRYFEGE